MNQRSGVFEDRAEGKAEIMNRPRQAPSIRYSGQCCFSASVMALAYGLLMVLLDELGDQSGPAGLVARTDSGAVVGVEGFVKRNQIAPMRVVLKFFSAAEDGSLPIRVQEEDLHEPTRNFSGDLPERHHLSRARRAFDLETVAEIVVELLQRLDEQEIDRKPDRAAPVGVAAK